jgi:DNA invertase Pin-like site-specific DNA recombinase
VFSDVETAKRAGRTEFGNMIAYLREHSRCRTVLVEKTDRLYRNIKDWVILDDIDLEIHFVKENKILSMDSNSSEKFLHGIRVLMAKNFLDNLSEETSKGMLEKARQGIWPSVAPVGYLNTLCTSGKKIIVPDPERSEMIRHLFEWYADGDISLKELAKKARETGLCHKGKGTPLTPSSIHRVITNRLYYGDIEWSGMVFQGKHKPLISRQLWQRVQERLTSRYHSKVRRVKYDFAYSRLIKCSHCGCSLVAERKKEGRLVYYHCSGYKGNCGEPYVREEELDRQFFVYLDALYFDEEVMEYVRGKLLQSRGDKRRFHREALNRLREEEKKLQSRLDLIYEDKLNGTINADLFQRKADECMKKLDQVASAIEHHSEISTEDIDKSIDLLELARSARELYMERSGAERRRLLKILLSNCTWGNGKLVAEFNQPFDMLAATNTLWKEKKASGGEDISISEIWYP